MPAKWAPATPGLSATRSRSSTGSSGSCRCAGGGRTAARADRRNGAAPFRLAAPPDLPVTSQSNRIRANLGQPRHRAGRQWHDDEVEEKVGTGELGKRLRPERGPRSRRARALGGGAPSALKIKRTAELEARSWKLAWIHRRSRRRCLDRRRERRWLKNHRSFHVVPRVITRSSSPAGVREPSSRMWTAIGSSIARRALPSTPPGFLIRRSCGRLSSGSGSSFTCRGRTSAAAGAARRRAGVSGPD